MSSKLTIAAVQFTAGPDWASHAAEVERLVRAAAGAGAQFVATPENTDGIVPVRLTVPLEDDHPLLPDFSRLASGLGIWLLCGSVHVKTDATATHHVNRSLLFAPDGSIAARYDKIHLFDVDLPGGESHRESASIQPGGATQVADMGGVKLGFSICYDLRFASLYRALALGGAEIIAVPSAFTVPTGEAHWEVLVRARAIETGACVIAPAQCGQHDGRRRTWGHSLIVDPWGRVLANAGPNPGIAIAMIDLEKVSETRRALPSLKHERDFTPPVSPIAGN